MYKFVHQEAAISLVDKDTSLKLTLKWDDAPKLIRTLKLSVLEAVVKVLKLVSLHKKVVRLLLRQK